MNLLLLVVQCTTDIYQDTYSIYLPQSTIHIFYLIENYIILANVYDLMFLVIKGIFPVWCSKHPFTVSYKKIKLQCDAAPMLR